MLPLPAVSSEVSMVRGLRCPERLLSGVPYKNMDEEAADCGVP